MKLNPYLNFQGKCEEAFKFYERCLGGKIVMMITHGESPVADQAPPEMRTSIMHARLIAVDMVLMGSDVPPEHYQKPQGITVSLGVNDPAEAERLFRALSEKGTIKMPIQETFWALRFGMFSDQYDVPWMINCERPRTE